MSIFVKTLKATIMKRILFLLLLLGNITFGYAQYSKEKLTDILTGGNVKSWTVKSATERPEKGFTFNKNMTVQVQKDKGAAQNDKWSLSSPDNIRWLLVIGNQSYEMIVSYDKGGSQYIKLTHKDAGKTTGGYEMTLYGGK